MRAILACLTLSVVCIAISVINGLSPDESKLEKKDRSTLPLGNFSVSLPVKDIEASTLFYEKLGFQAIFGSAKQKMVIMQNETSTIGLFQEGVEQIGLTYNPGWDRNGQKLSQFTDVRDLQKSLKERGIEPKVAADESSTGPAFIIVHDPDGNPILLDQHVPKPKTSVAAIIDAAPENPAKSAALAFASVGLRLSVAQMKESYFVFEESKGSGVFQFYSRDSDILKGLDLNEFDPRSVTVFGGYPEYFMISIDEETLRVTNCYMQRK